MPPTAVVTGSKDSAEELNCDFQMTDSQDDQDDDSERSNGPEPEASRH